MDAKAVIDDYLGYGNETNRENANFVRHISRLEGAIAARACREYWLDNIWSSEFKSVVTDGLAYPHDAGKLAPYCSGFSAKDVAMHGLRSNCGNLLSTRPPKHLSSLIGQMYNFVILISQEVAGAVALNDATTIVASYLWYTREVRGETFTRKQLENEWESFIYNVGLPLRAGGQSPFSNILLEFGACDPHLRDEYIVIGGECLDKKYSDIPVAYFDEVNMAFTDAMSKKDPEGRPLTFPLITVNIYDDFDWTNAAFEYLLTKMYGWGGVYFESYLSKPFEDPGMRKINPMLQPRDPESQRSFCCRFQVNMDDILKAGGGNPFRSQSGVGGVGVVNLNVNRLFLKHGHNQTAIEEDLTQLVRVSNDMLMERRKFILDHKDLYPMFFWYNKDLSTFFNVISVCGFHEGLVNIGYRDGMLDEMGRDMVHSILQTLSEVIKSEMGRLGVPVGLEAAPSESAAVKFAQADLRWGRENGREVYVSGNPETGDVWLTSGSMLPFQDHALSSQWKVSYETQAYFTSGSVLHVFLNEKMENDALKSLIKKLFSKPLVYMSITPTISGCGACGHQMTGEYFTCPSCGSDDMFVASRVIGYLRPIARKSLTKEDGQLNGKEVYWRDERRTDWVGRHKVEAGEILSF